MNRPTHLMSVPVDIPSGPAQLDEIYKGMALYNTGLITLAYKLPVRLLAIRRGGVVTNMIDLVSGPDERIELDFRVMWPDGEHPMFGKVYRP